MAKRKNKFDIISALKTVAAGSVGGYIGDMVTGQAEKILVEKDPKYMNMAPAITSAAAILGGAFTERGTLINDAINGMGVVAGTELIQGMLAKDTTPPATGTGTGTGADTGTGTGTGRNIQGRKMLDIVKMNGTKNIARMNGGSPYNSLSNNPYMY